MVSGPTAVPEVSVIMAVWNGERYLGLALDSVLSQSYSAFEFIIIDDCSTDRTPAMIRERNDPRIVYLRNETNLGQTASLNRGLELARAPLIARIDADDIWLPGKLERQMVYLAQHPEVTVLGTWASRIDLEGRVLGPNRPPVGVVDVAAKLLRGVPVCHVSVVMRREAVLAAGRYDTRYRFAADYALWSALARGGAVITSLPETLTQYRENPQTFGAAQKVGAAGDESADIIRLNARAFAGVELSQAECRDIALLYFPEAGLSPNAFVRAYRNLRRLQRGVAGRVPLRAAVELMAALFWGLTKKWSRSRRQGAAIGGELWGTIRAGAGPGVTAVALSAGLCSVLGEDRLLRVKSRLAPLLARRGR